MGAEPINWDGESSPRSVSKFFDETFPYYLAIGMTYDQFWNDRAELAKIYREADEIKRNRENEMLWVGGLYTAHALGATVGNMFNKGKKNKYPSAPIPLTEAAAKAQREREQEIKLEKAKANMIAWAEKWKQTHPDAK